MADVEPEDFDLSELGISEYAQPVGLEVREFQPWHRPRKQWVRRNQWLNVIRDLMNDLPADRPLTYLSLPGADLLDVRAIVSGVCEPAGRSLRFLGVNSGLTAGSPEATAANTSHAEMLANPHVHNLSNVIHDDIRRLEADNSMVSRTAASVGPFDIVNLDLCGSAAADTPLSESSIYTALTKLAATQSKRTDPWVFLLTTRTDSQSVDLEAAKVLRENALHLLAQCPDVAAPILEFAGITDLSSIDIEDCSAAQFNLVMVIGFCWWFYRQLAEHGPTKLKLISSVGYSVLGDDMDMISIAIRATPMAIAQPDPGGLAPPPQVMDVDPCIGGKSIATRTAKTVNVDQRLVDYPAERAVAARETKELLTQARYDTSGYDAWAEA